MSPRSFSDSRQYALTVETEPRRGINWARNAGIRVAPDGVVLLCDADDEVHPEWVSAMSAAIRPGTWVGGALDYVALNSARTREVWDAPDRSQYTATDPFVDRTYGCNCGFLRSMWEEIGGFDTALSGTGGDENELFMRAHGAGYRNVDVPDAVVSYRLRPGVWSMARQRYRQGRNQVRMGRLAGGALLPEPIELLPTIGATAWRLLAAPKYLRTARRRCAWLGSVSRQVGRLVGLVRRDRLPDANLTPIARRTSAGAPVVSVLLPVYDGADSVGRAIDSVLAQSFVDFELVVVDDGSTDGTAAVLAHRAATDRRVRIVTHDVNRGLVASLNDGLAACRGDLVARLDADDWAAPTRLARQVEVFGAHPSTVLCATAYDRVDPNGRLIRTGVPPQTHAALAVAMLTGNRIQHSTVMFRRDAVEQAGGYDDTWFPVEDYDLWLRLLPLGQFRSLATTEVTYVVGDGGISGRLAEQQRVAVIERAQRYLGGLMGTQPTAGSSMSVRDVARATDAVRADLRRRGVSRAGLDRQALLVANSVTADRSRRDRALAVLSCRPAPRRDGSVVEAVTAPVRIAPHGRMVRAP